MLSTTSASAAPSMVASVTRVPATGMPIASRCTALIAAACVEAPPCAHPPAEGGQARMPRFDAAEAPAQSRFRQTIAVRDDALASAARVPGEDVVAGEQGEHAAE